MAEDVITWKQRYEYLESTIYQIFVGLAKKKLVTYEDDESAVILSLSLEPDDSSLLVCRTSGASPVYEFVLIRQSAVLSQRKGMANCVRLIEDADRVIVNLWSDSGTLLASKEIGVGKDGFFDL